MASDGNLWDYSTATGGPARPYGSDETYRLGLPWLDLVCDTIEDWGAGMAYGRQFVSRGTYTAIDSSPTAKEWVDVIGSLENRQSEPDGIFMRHILEHNLNWAEIISHAVECFQKRMVLVMFTPFAQATSPTFGRDRYDIHFRREDLTEFFDQYLVAEQTLTTDTQFRWEHVFYLSKEDGEQLVDAMDAAAAKGATCREPVA